MKITVVILAVVCSAFAGHFDGDYDHHEKYHGPPAPLNHDGTVAETPEVKHAKSVFLAAHAAELAHADHSWVEPEYKHHESKYNDYSDHHEDEHHYPSHYEHSEDSHSKKYHGPPAPLNHDGTVAETPEVKHAKAVHFQLFNQAIHRHRRAVHFEPAPLNPDGTVAETPEIQHAKAAFFAAHAAEYARADHSWVEPDYKHEEPKYQHYVQPVQYQHSHYPTIKSTYQEPEHHAPQYTAPHHHSKHFEPAPLNHDGTVADTEAIKAAKAIHYAAYQEAHSRIAPPKYAHFHH